MRLEKLTIGGPLDHASNRFKNLKDVTIDFDADHWVTVAIGWNGTGKSNILEAVAIIFRELMSDGTPSIPFAFYLSYRIGKGEKERRITVRNDPTVGRGALRINVGPLAQGDAGNLDLSPLSIRAFRQDPENLPRYVFSYYSGESTRLRDVFAPYSRRYDEQLRSGRDPGLKRLFYATPDHSQFVLLAFLIHEDPVIHNFLRSYLGIDPLDGVESVLFVIREPPWNSTAPDGDARFWNARGVVQTFLDRLMDVAVAPISLQRLVPVSPWNRRRLGFKYLFVPDLAALRDLVGSSTSAEFFRDLESTHVSQLIDEVRIRIRLGTGETVTFRELSEGEQQLLTVLGLLRFTAEEESLFLLDEPDTHLNPRWSVDYLDFLELFLNTGDAEQSSHVIMTTHNPISIAGLVREQVQVITRSDGAVIAAQHPAVAPRGMGFAGVITSDMFGLGSSLDRPTAEQLFLLHALSERQTLTPLETEVMVQLRDRLAGLDFNFAARDRLEQEFRRARFDLTGPPGEGEDPVVNDPIVTPENKALALRALVSSLVRSLGDEPS